MPASVRGRPHRQLAVLVAVVVVTTVVTGIVAAQPPRPGTADNGLTENESATLWSRDADGYSNQAEYRQRYGENRSAVHQVANGTDITFKRPPATASTWTRNDFEDLDGGSADTSVHPPHADLEDGVFIRDAHATIFAAQPATRGHLAPGETPRYIAPNGSMRGFVDYRVRVPDGRSAGNRTTEWSLTAHEIESVRLMADGETIATQDGSKTPILDYRIEDDSTATLTLEAEISVRLRKTTRVDRGNRTEIDVSYRTESRTVSDTIDVEVYDLSASVYSAEYPNGDAGAAIFQSRPWQGYTLTANDSTRVRGVWRFYTARDTSWDTLVRTDGTSRETSDSDAIPVFVHAYPSRIGPRAEPVRDGPEIMDTWGTTESSPAASLGEHINVDVETGSYTASHGVAVRAGDIDPDAIRVAGIVRGVNASLTEPDNGFERSLDRSTLTATVLERNQSGATVRVTLRSADSGEPIVLDDSARDVPVAGPERNGSIIIAEQRVKTNASGVAVVTIDQPGIYTARYHPGSWVSQSSAFVGDAAIVRWHPLGTLDGWVTLVVEVGWQLLPFVVALYAGRRLLAVVGGTKFSERP